MSHTSALTNAKTRGFKTSSVALGQAKDTLEVLKVQKMGLLTH